jgi:hypothetical protein
LVIDLCYKLSDFNGDLSFFGDIHKMQFLDNDKHKAYCGSLIAQDFSEGDDNFHGYLLWDIQTKKAELISIHNDYSFKNIRVTSYVDFDDLDFEIENPTKFMKIRFIWNTFPQTRTKENERKIIEYIKSKYENLVISHKNEFLESEKIEINENITLENIIDKTVQQEIFKEYLILSKDAHQNYLQARERVLKTWVSWACDFCENRLDKKPGVHLRTNLRTVVISQ